MIFKAWNSDADFHNKSLSQSFASIDRDRNRLGEKIIFPPFCARLLIAGRIFFPPDHRKFSKVEGLSMSLAIEIEFQVVNWKFFLLEFLEEAILDTNGERGKMTPRRLRVVVGYLPTAERGRLNLVAAEQSLDAIGCPIAATC